MADLGATIAFLLGWLATSSPYTEADRLPPPTIALRTQFEIDRGCATCVSGGAIATYDCPTKTLAISREAIAKLGMQVDAILAHELTHHAQCARWGALPQERWCEAEREAYEVSARYVIFALGDLPESRAAAQRHRDAAAKVCAAQRR